ncbi:MAG TPA: DUF58 domain-containing protein [Blastocatellia bacterium]|jgi:uncharacterized protein (DUF58 family)
MNRQAWRDFFITVALLGIAFLIALFSSVAAEQSNGKLAAIAAAVSLVLALLGALYIIPKLARNVRLELLRFAIRTTVTVEGLLFIVFLVIIGFAAWNTGNNLLYLVLSAMLAFLVAANIIGRVSLGDLAVQLRFPDHVFAGEPAHLSVTLINHKRVMPSFSLMVEALAEPGEEDDSAARGESLNPRRNAPAAREPARENKKPPPRAPKPSKSEEEPGIGQLAYYVLIPARASARQKVEHTFEQRGRYPITGFRIATKFPAGFFKKWRRVDAAGEILVYPKPRPLDDFYHALPMLAGQIHSHVRGMGDDLYGIRRYHPSDHMRTIHWKATAKSMQMMVREHTREDERRLVIAFDTKLPPEAALKAWGAGAATAEAGEEPHSKKEADRQSEAQVRAGLSVFQEKFERAVVMAASLANHFILERADVALVATDGARNVGPGSGPDHLYKLLRALATIQPSAPEESEPPPGRTRSRWRLGRGRGDNQKQAARAAASEKRAEVGISWRLLEEMPLLGDDRRFKVLITSAPKGTIPAHVWRSAHVVFMDDL